MYQILCVQNTQRAAWLGLWSSSKLPYPGSSLEQESFPRALECAEVRVVRVSQARELQVWILHKSGCVCEGNSCVWALLHGHSAWRRGRNVDPAGRSEQGFYSFLQLHLLLSLCFRNAEKRNWCCFAAENVCFALNILTGGFFHRLSLSFLSTTSPACSNQPKKKESRKKNLLSTKNHPCLSKAAWAVKHVINLLAIWNKPVIKAKVLNIYGGFWMLLHLFCVSLQYKLGRLCLEETFQVIGRNIFCSSIWTIFLFAGWN